MSLHARGDETPTSRGVQWFTATAAVESVGDSLARSLLPIVAVSALGAGTATVGVLNSLGLGAFLLLALPVGVLADCWSAPVSMMTVSSLVRAGATLGVVAAWAAGQLSGAVGLMLLLAFALTMGIADVVFTAGQGLLVPRLVEPEEIRGVFGRMQTATQAGGAIGPLVLSGLLALLAAPLVWVASTVMYLVSAAAQRGIAPLRPGPPPQPRVSMWAMARAGTGQLFAHPLLARITVANVLNNAAVMAANTLLPVIALTVLGLAPAVYAGIGVVGALAGIAGAMTASTITARLGLRITRLASSAAMTLGAVLVMLTATQTLPGPPAAWLGLQSALAASATAVAMVAGSDLAPRLVDPERLGTVMGAQRTLVLGIMPVAAVTTGLLGSTLGTITTTWVWLVLAVTSAVPILTLPRGEESRPEL